MAFREFTCPSCGGRLLYQTDAETDNVVCESCGNSWNVKDLENKPSYRAESETAVSAVAAAVSYIDDSESAMAWLENHFETYEWNDFIMTSVMTLPEVDRVVEKLIIKQGASPATWQLQFTSLATPIAKKIKGLQTLDSRFAEAFAKTGDPVNGFAWYDAYKNIAGKLSSCSAEIVKKLEGSIKYFQKYGGSREELEGMNMQLDRIKSDLEQIKPIESHSELPGYAKAKEEYRQRLVADLSAKGINAEDVYIHAVSDYKSGGDRRLVLAAFESIAGYKDADHYINKINTLFEFAYSTDKNELIRLGDKYYVYRVPVTEPFDPTATGPEGANQPAETNNKKAGKKGCGKQKGAPEEVKPTAVAGACSMFEVVDTLEQKEPKITGITHLLSKKNKETGKYELAHYGGYLIYVKNNTQLCVFNSNASDNVPAETVVLTVKPGEFEYGEDAIKFFIKGRYFFVTKRLEAMTSKKNGCFAQIFKKKKKIENVVSNKNNFSLIAFDLSTGEVKTAIPELVTLTEIMDKHIFYTMVKEENGIESEDFYAYDIERKASEKVLDADTEIVDVVDGKLIYFQYTPNSLNRDMYALNMMTGDKKLLDANVYDYYRTINGKLYYNVGNYNYKTLYSINPDGKGKKEVLQNSSRLDLSYAELRNGWLYLKSGVSLNATLKKVNVENGNVVNICTQFKRLVCFSDGYIYYIDSLNRLCTVREDGKEWKVVLSNVGNVLNVSTDAIYLLKEETVGVVDVSGVSYRSNSLYKVDVTGHNLTKIAFDVVKAEINPYNKKEIYLYRSIDKRYKISVPVDKEKYEVTYETYNIRSIVLYNTETNVFTDVAVFGKPEQGEAKTFKSGCFGRKKVTKECLLEEVPHKIKYIREGAIKAGAVGNAQVGEANVAQAEEKAEKKNNSGCGAKK